MGLPTAVAIVAVLTFAAVVYFRAVRRTYRLRGIRPKRLSATTQDGWCIAVHQRTPAVRRFSEPVLLCHGLATNHLNLDFDPPYSLALAFADAGFEVFSVDWRGAGVSRPPAGRGRFDFDADDLIHQDAPAVMDLVLSTTRAKQLFWVGHSLGGLVGYAVLGGPDGPRLRGLCSLGAPVYFRYPRWLASIMRLCLVLAWPFAFRQRLFSLLCAPFVGRVTLPLSDVLVNPKAIAPAVLRCMYANLIDSMGFKLLRQLDDWTRHDRFCSRDGARDYRARLADVRTPVLVLGGTEDGLAPPASIHGQA
jgi:pimeloyl-ACP methyl ester carboxylesterase